MRPIIRLELAVLAVMTVIASWQSSGRALAAPAADLPDAPARLSETGLYAPL